MGKEQPLKHSAVVIWFRLGVKREEVGLVIVLSEVEEYSRSFEDGNRVAGVVDNDRDPAVRV